VVNNADYDPFGFVEEITVQRPAQIETNVFGALSAIEEYTHLKSVWVNISEDRIPDPFVIHT
jgi:hypothetical protein